MTTENKSKLEVSKFQSLRRLGADKKMRFAKFGVQNIRNLGVRRLAVLAFIAIIIAFTMTGMLFSCASSREFVEDSDRKLYESVNLEFALTYPLDWIVFEGSDSILISTDKDNVALPQEEVLKNKNVFLMTVSLEENSQVGEFITHLKKSSFSNIISANEDVYRMYDIQEVLSSDTNTELEAMYLELFGEEFSSIDSIGFWDEGIILGNIIDIDNEIGSIIILNQLQGDIFTIMKIVYNDGIESASVVPEGINICKSIFLL